VSKQIPIAVSHSDAGEGKYRNRRFFSLTGIWDSISPVVRVGHPEFSDIERPAWCVSMISVHQIGLPAAFSSCSINSQLDIAIESIQWAVTVWNTGTSLQRLVLMFTPPANYIPFQTNGLYWQPWVRPTIKKYASHNTVGITGRNVVPTPYMGWQMYSCDDGTGGVANERMDFDPPLILPATQVLSLQTQVVYDALAVSFRYREL